MNNSIDIDVLEVLGIDVARLSKDLIRSAKFRKLPIQDFTEENIKKAFLSGIEVELEDFKNERSGTRVTITTSTGVKNYRIKNVKRNFKDFIASLVYSVKAMTDLSVTDLIFALISIFKALQISLSSDEAFVFLHFYRSSEKITDRNLVKIIKKAITHDSYNYLSEQKIRDIVKSLIQKDMLEKKGKVYSITDGIVVHWRKLK